MEKRGFISHINEESQVAEYIKSWCNRTFQGQLDLFVSSLDMGPGSWLDQIRSSVRASSFVFPLLSRISMGMPWINFESGAAFMADEVQLIPVCHKDLVPSGLVDPYSSFQAYDLRRSDSVLALVRHLSHELDLDAPQVDTEGFSHEILRLDKILHRFFSNFEGLRSTDELREDLAHVENPREVRIDGIEIWDELELRARIHNNRVVEANGYTRDSMGFDVQGIEVPKGCKYLLVEFENTDNAISRDQDKLVKIVINRQTVKAFVAGQVHYNDSQFTIKGDGFFAFQLPSAAKYTGKVDVGFAFWRIEFQGLLIRLYLA